jgi:hypothetical protein
MMVLVHMNDAVRLPLWFDMWAHAQCFEENECSEHERNPFLTDTETHQNTRASCCTLHMHDQHQDTFAGSCNRHGVFVSCKLELKCFVSRAISSESVTIVKCAGRKHKEVPIN